MNLYDKLMLRKRSVIETVNDELIPITYKVKQKAPLWAYDTNNLIVWDVHRNIRECSFRAKSFCHIL